MLACILNHPATAMPECQARMKANRAYFYDHRHQTIYRYVVDMVEAQIPIEELTLIQRLRLGGSLEEAGGHAYINELHNTVVATIDSLPHYLEVVLDQHLLRRSIALASQFVEKAMDCRGQPADKVVLDFESALAEITEEQAATGQEKALKTIIVDVINDMEQRHYTRGKTQLRGLPTGPPGNYLDKLLQGIQETYYLVLAGRPGDGKSSFAMNIAEYLAIDYVWHEPTGETYLNEDKVELPVTRERKGIPIAVFSIEMDNQSLGYRLLFGRSGVSRASYTEGFAEKDADENLKWAAGQLASAKVWVDDTPGQSIGQIAAKARRMAKQHGIKLFILDYIQLVELENGNGMDRVRELRKVSRKIQALKKQLKVPWIVLAQMNRNIETAEVKRPPVLSDLKECGSIEEDADAVMMLYKPIQERRRKGHDSETDDELIERVTSDWEWSRRPKRMNVFVAKNRFGPVGHAHLLFSPNLQRFEDFHRWKVAHNADAFKAGESRKGMGLPSNEEMGLE